MVKNVKIFNLKELKKATFDSDVSIPLSNRYNLRGFDNVILPNKQKTLKRKK